MIIPCFNHAHYLPHAVNSVVAQTFTDWEAIIVDDGSTDNTREVAAQFTDPRIRTVYQANHGLSAARNTGIRAAQGEYLAFLDADDEWDLCFLEVCVEALSAQKTLAAVVTLARFIDENGRVLPRMGGQAVGVQEFRSRLLVGGFFPVNAIVVRSEAVHSAGLFDEQLTSVEDWDLWLRITANGGQMLSIPQPLACYRVVTGSMSTNAARMHANRLAVLAKHFGPLEGDLRAWPAEKRLGYAFAYRTTALGYIAQQEPDEGWRFLRQAAQIDPVILQRLDTFYELALGDQPRGYRGEARLVNLARNGTDMLQRLDELFSSADSPVKALRSAAYGNAYLALVMISDQAGDWAEARRYMRQAVRSNPTLLRSAAHMRRLLKLHAGQKLIQVLRPARGFTGGAAK